MTSCSFLPIQIEAQICLRVHQNPTQNQPGFQAWTYQLHDQFPVERDHFHPQTHLTHIQTTTKHVFRVNLVQNPRPLTPHHSYQLHAPPQIQILPSQLFPHRQRKPFLILRTGSKTTWTAVLYWRENSTWGIRENWLAGNRSKLSVSVTGLMNSLQALIFYTSTLLSNWWNRLKYLSSMMTISISNSMSLEITSMTVCRRLW
jgi:hypothetical protein